MSAKSEGGRGSEKKFGKGGLKKILGSENLEKRGSETKIEKFEKTPTGFFFKSPAPYWSKWQVWGPAFPRKPRNEIR